MGVGGSSAMAGGVLDFELLDAAQRGFSTYHCVHIFLSKLESAPRRDLASLMLRSTSGPQRSSS